MPEMEEQKRKKLCIIMPTHWTHKIGGAEYQVKCIIDVLVASGKYDIYFITRHVDPSYTPVGYKIIKIQNIFGVRRGRYVFDAFVLLRALRQIRPDVIYQRRGLAYTGFAANYAHRYGCKFVWHIAHDDDVTPLEDSAGDSKSFLKARRLPGQFLHIVEKKILEYGIRNADRIISQTSDQANYLKCYYGKTPSTIMHNFHPLPKEEIRKSATVNVVWVANVKPMKQPQIFLRLARDLGHLENVTFTMIGALEGGRRSEEMASKIRATPEVHYLGAICQEEVNTILAGAGILVNTSTREGFSNTFIQAWMRKVPVISLCINPDAVFDNEKVGYCSGNYEKLRENVARLIQNRQLREDMGGWAEEYAVRNYSYSQAEKLLSLL